MPLGATTGLLAAGAQGDNYGRRPVFLWGLVVMAVASVLAALAVSGTMQVLARVLQGLGAAAVMACGLGLLSAAYADRTALTRATTIWGAALGAGVAAGPIFAALATTLGGWPLAYWSTGILAAALLLATRSTLPAVGAAQHQPLDWRGTALLMAGLALLTSGLTEMQLGWARPNTLALDGGGIAAIAAFVWAEKHHSNPILDLRLFSNPGFIAATAAAFASGAGGLALMLLVPILMSRAMGHSALTGALVLCAWSATSVITAIGAHWLPDWLTPKWLMMAGLALCAAAQAMLLGLAAGSPVLRLLPGLIVAGAANGVLNAVLGRQAVATVPPDRAALGSGANNFARYIGSAIGITFGAVLMVHGAEAGGVSGLLGGWNMAIALTAGFSLIGAITVAVIHERGA